MILAILFQYIISRIFFLKKVSPLYSIGTKHIISRIMYSVI